MIGMHSSYEKKDSVVQRESVPISETVVDSSSQNAALQRKASLANVAAQRAPEPRPNLTGMPDNLKRGIESLSGFSMDDVRVHYNSSKPATVQALAYTQGTDIHVAPGQEHTLPHEAWHVAQQMAGRVSPTTNINGMPVNDNAGLEHEADVMGEKAVQCKNKPITLFSVSCKTDNLQRYVKIASRNTQRGMVWLNTGKPNENRFDLLKNFDFAWRKVYGALRFLFGLRLVKDKYWSNRLKVLLREWMGVDGRGNVDELCLKSDAYRLRAEHGVRAEFRYYHNYNELAYALAMNANVLGLTARGDLREVEEEIAYEVLRKDEIKKSLKGVIEAIVKSEDFKNVNKDKMSFAYWEYYKTNSFKEGKSSKYEEFIRQCESAKEVGTMIALLHDLKDLMLGVVFKNESREPMLELDCGDRKKISIKKRTMRYNVGTVDEADDWTLFMRERGRNLWAGPSYTAYQMIKLALKYGGDAKSVAYAIFAFWCVKYQHTATPIHTFHEVMSTAQSCGVLYNPKETIKRNYQRNYPG